MPSVATWWCGERLALDYALDNLEGLVIKPAYPNQKFRAVLGFDADARLDLMWRLRAQPHAYVAQQRLTFFFRLRYRAAEAAVPKDSRRALWVFACMPSLPPRAGVSMARHRAFSGARGGFPRRSAAQYPGRGSGAGRGNAIERHRGRQRRAVRSRQSLAQHPQGLSAVMRYRVRHETVYHYGGDLTHSHQLLHSNPRNLWNHICHSRSITPHPEPSSRRGVCQDFTHIMLACLRSRGLAARYVSGYLRTAPPGSGTALLRADASHAWLSVFCSPLGRIGLDPTNGVRVGTDHIVIAWGRDFGDVSPLRGAIVRRPTA